MSCKYRLKTHLERYHMNIRKYECPECFSMFKSRDNLHDHMSKHPKPIELDPEEVARFRAQAGSARIEIPVPKLTSLVMHSSDPDLRPFTIIRRVYPYPIEEDQVLLPKIEGARTIVSNPQRL